MPTLLTCRHCQASLAPEQVAGLGYTPCASCGQPHRVELFPAWEHTERVPTEPQPVVADEAGCFYHGGSRAEASCSRCGRFLCSLCNLPLGDQHFCAPCLEEGRHSGSMPEMVTGSTRWDVLVLLLALLPIVLLPMFYFSLFTAPLALFLGLFFWRRPVSLVPRHRGLFLVGMALALAQAGLWAAGIYWIIYQIVSS